MKVNNQKTQLLCIHANKISSVKTYIKTDTGEIESTDTLRILGFDFNNIPSATHHVMGVIDRLYNKLWTLRFLKKSGMDQQNLFKVYISIIRPSVEYCAEVYDSLIPKYVVDRLESVQRQACKIIFGWGVDYSELVEEGKVQTLASRRRQACINFAMKALVSPTFGEKWFPRNMVTRNARESTRRVFVERRTKTERARSNPIDHMIRLLNEQMST